MHWIWLISLQTVLFAFTCSRLVITRVKCESYNKTWVEINECRVRLVRCNQSLMNINVTLHHPAYKVHVNAALLRKGNRYQPFLLNYTIDACSFYESRNNQLANLIFEAFQDFSNLNHSCPYVGEHFVKDLHLRNELFEAPLPNGDYSIVLTWIFSLKRTFMTNVYFSFESKLNK